MKKSITQALILAGIASAVAHFYCDISDDFTVLDSGGVAYKIFFRGWPFAYIVEGPFANSSWKISAYICIDFLIQATLCFAALAVFNALISLRKMRAHR